MSSPRTYRLAPLSLLLGAVVLVAALAAAGSALAAPRVDRAPTAERGGIIIALDKTATAEQAAAAVGAARGEVRHSVAGMRSLLVEVPTGADEAQVASKVSALPGVRYAEPNGRVYAQVVPNDANYSLQWGLPAVNAPLAWSGARGSSAVKVAVIDSGVYFGHPDLAGVLDAGLDYDFVNDDSDASDDNGHGTHVTGIIAAVTNNGTGVASLGGFGAGAIGGVRVIPYKVLDKDGAGWDEDVAQAIRRAADAGARVLNLSVGGTDSSTALTEAVAYARARGCVVVSAAGNAGLEQVMYPAGIAGVIGVSSVDSQLRQAIFSNYGPHVDVCAPGEQVYSTAWPPAIGGGGQPYGYMSGTSMATPFVAAEAALLFSAKRTATGAQVENAILTSAKDLGPAGRDESFGRGIIDAARALSVLVGYDYTPPVTTAANVPSGWSSRDVTLTLSATDDLSGVASTYLKVGNGADTFYTAPVALRGEGTTSFTFWSIDRAGNRESAKSGVVRIDKTAPITTSDAGLRYVGTATINLSAQDGVSGVASTSWSLDGVAGSGNIVRTSAHGFHTLTYRSTDAAGNAEETHAIGFAVLNWADEMLPLTTTALGVPAGWSSVPATITLVSSSYGQPGSTVWYSLDGGVPVRYTGPFVVSKQGTTRLETWASVNGTTEERRSASIRIDSVAPELKITAKAVYDDEASIGATAFDSGSGLDPGSIAWSIDGAKWFPGDVATIPWPGRYVLRFRVQDLVGNVGYSSTPLIVTTSSSAALRLASASTPAWGSPVRLTGSVSPAPSSPATVSIEARAAGSSAWVRVAIARTDVRGDFSATGVPKLRTEYRAVFAGDGVLRAASPTRSVTVVPKAWLAAVSGVPPRPKAGQVLRLSGRVVPAHTSAVYLIVEKWTGSRWVKAAQNRLALRSDGRGGSVWATSRRASRGTWRLRVYHASDSVHATGYSAARYARVK